MPLIETTGSASSKALGLNSASQQLNYIEDVFSTYLYVGNGSTQTITNSIDLAGKGGLVWIKDRTNAYNHVLTDTVRGATSQLYSNLTNAATTSSVYLSAFTSSGFSVGNSAPTNTSSANDVSWTFRKQPKFFDVVTAQSNAFGVVTFNHSLGSVPGCVFVKCVGATENWYVYHRSITNPNDNYLILNSTAATTNFGGAWTAMTSTQVTFEACQNFPNVTYVAYIFAHNAGGFGTAGTDNVISCGSWTGSAADINLGYEPQWLLVKKNNSAWPWYIVDNMRGLYADPTSATYLLANTSAAETTAINIKVTSTGFTQAITSAGETAYYIAIRRGPMKTPTSGTSVFSPAIYTGNDVDGRLISSGFPVDGAIIDPRNGYSTPGGPNWFSRLTGNGYFLQTAQTNAESNGSSNSNGIMGQDGITVSRNGTNVWSNVSSNTYVSWFLRRAPSFYDVVCFQFSGTTNTNRRVNHNLGVVPEMWIMKRRSPPDSWYGYHSALGRSTYFTLNSTAQPTPQTNAWGTANPTSTDFGVNESVFSSGTDNNIVYLFASCPGVSNVGSYTGNGTSQTINCGFASGARFVLIKETSGTGNWAVWDTARGMTSGGSPYLFLNSTAAEGTPVYVTTTSVGFNLTTSTFNSNGVNYIFLAIA